MNQRGCVLGSYCPLSLSHCAQGSEKESETGVWDGHSAGVRFIHLPSSPLPHPSVSSLTSRHLSPRDGLFRSSSLHLFPPYIILSFLSSFFFILCLSTHPSLCSCPSLFLCVFWWTNWQWHRRSVWRQGLPIPATCLGFFVLSCMLSHDAKETQMIYIQSVFLLLHAPFVMLSGTFSYLFFVIVMKSSHPLPLTLSAGYKLNLLSRPTDL